ncbi:MAG TPA: hypothetical protein VFF79_02525 [Conexibacter sp.]|jgi:hypothetical protein|nr:hypothetical protein [Conexibacter sp.]
MKTTVDIAESMLKDAKLIAAREGTTLRSLVEEGLRHVIDERAKAKSGFRLRDMRFRGDGGVPGVDPDDWMSIKHIVRGAGS